MELYIDNPEKLQLEDFIEQKILPILRQYIEEHIDQGPVEAIEDYLNSPEVQLSLLLNPREQLYVSARNIILAAAANLVINRFDGDYIIRVDAEKLVPRLKAKLVDLASLVNYGSLGSPAYPIFDNAFNEVAAKFATLYKEYAVDVT